MTTIGRFGSKMTSIGNGCDDVEGDKDDDMNQVSLWIGSLPLTFRPKTQVSQSRMERDFADGYTIAMIINQVFPKLVELHNYGRSSSLHSKRENWFLLRRKLLSKLDITVSDEEIEKIIEAIPGAINRVLKCLYEAAMRSEADKRVAEEDKRQNNLDNFPPDEWKQDVCQSRRDGTGNREYMINGKLVIPKDDLIAHLQSRDNEVGDLRNTNEQLRSQVARLMMTVDLKESRLGELTHQLSILQRNGPTVIPPIAQLMNTVTPGPQGDVPMVKSVSKFFSPII